MPMLQNCRNQSALTYKIKEYGIVRMIKEGLDGELYLSDLKFPNIIMKTILFQLT
jgi:hypothetical protein